MYDLTYTQKFFNKKVTEKEIRLGLIRGRGWKEAELEEGGPKVQTSSYK